MASSQVGFLLLEFGHVAPKNSRTVILKNTLDNAFGIVAWLFVGYTLAGGAHGKGNRLFGTDWKNSVMQWQHVEVVNDFERVETPRGAIIHTAAAHPDVLWTFFFAFSSSAATIVSGSIAERAQLRAHLILAVFMSGIIYPVAAYWIWSVNGWLSSLAGAPCASGRC
jgi:ammonium transporter, Amt family